MILKKSWGQGGGWALWIRYWGSTSGDLSRDRAVYTDPCLCLFQEVGFTQQDKEELWDEELHSTTHMLPPRLRKCYSRKCAAVIGCIFLVGQVIRWAVIEPKFVLMAKLALGSQKCSNYPLKVGGQNTDHRVKFLF